MVFSKKVEFELTVSIHFARETSIAACKPSQPSGHGQVVSSRIDVGHAQHVQRVSVAAQRFQSPQRILVTLGQTDNPIASYGGT